MRRFLLILVVLAASPTAAQDTVRGSSEERRLDREIDLDRGPVDHLGWGTAEDLFADVGLGAAVSAFSGNLVVTVDPFPRGDAIPGARMTLTYNHGDPDGSPELGQGWSWDLGRSWTPGPWGDRVLIDADGFRDSFFASDPPSGEELEDMVEDVISAWRRSTPPATRTRVGGARALRSLLTSDPLVFGEMRLRYLGAPEPADKDALYRSSNRGERWMETVSDGIALHRSDGGVERYGKNGELRTVDAPGYPTTEVIRENGRLVGVDVAGSRLFRIDLDSQGRIEELKDAAGRTAVFMYAGPRLHRITLPRGRVSLEYDDAGRLTVVRAPEGMVAAEYEADSGRVRRLAGPHGGADISSLATEGNRISMRVRTPDGDPIDCSWDGDSRTLEVASGDAERRVRFDARRPLPVEVEEDGVVTQFTWDGAGQIASAERSGRTTRWQRDSQGSLTAIIEPSGERATVQQDRDGRPNAWIDPAGRRSTLQYDRRGSVRMLGRAGVGDESTKRSSAGALLGVNRSGSPDIMLRRDSRGMLWSADVPFLGTASLRYDDGGRLIRFEGTVGAGVELDRRRDGSIVGISDGATSVRLTRDGAGRLTGWTGSSSLGINRDAAGRVAGTTGDRGWELQRRASGAPQRITTADGVAREIVLDAGFPERIGRWGGGDLEFSLGRDGRVNQVVAAGLGRLDLDRDSAGRVIEIGRGVGRWRIARDRSGLPTTITDASGGAAELGRGPGGRVDRVVLPHDVRWSFTHGEGGRLREAVGEGGAWSLRRRPTGLPNAFLTPDRAAAEVDWDTRGRALKVTSDPFGEVEITYSSAGPTAVGGTVLRWGPKGRLASWGPTTGGYAYRRNASGRVTEVAKLKQTGRGDDPFRVEHDRGGRPTQVGSWAATWRRGGLGSLTRGPNVWTWTRDAAGMVRSLAAPGGSVALRRTAEGDVRELEINAAEAGTWTLRRDSSGRVVAAAGVADWALIRDALGRPASWTLSSETTTLAGVVTHAPRSRSLAVGAVDAPPMFTLTDRWTREGQPEGSTTQGLEVGPPPPYADGPDPIGQLLGTDDPLADVLLQNTASLWWAGVPVVDGGGYPVLPSPVGGGPGLSGAHHALTDGRGDIATWVSAEGSADGPDSIPDGVPASRAGDAGPVTDWWSGLQTAAGDRARMLPGVGADAAAWRSPRRARRARGSGLTEVDVPTGVGAFVPPVPGADRSFPEARHSRRVGLVEALVLSGDLSPEALRDRGFLPVAPDAWQVEIVGVDVLADLARRRWTPNEAPGIDAGAVVGFAPDGNGLILDRARQLDTAPSFDLKAAATRLPSGTADVLPQLKDHLESNPHAPSGRGGALDRLSDESLGTPGVAAAIAEDEALLLALRRFVPVLPSPLSGRLQAPIAAELWRIETPLGVVIHLDRRGRLVSIDTQGRLHRSYGEACTAAAGRSLVFDRSEAPPGLQGMPFLPSPGPVLESRWGLAPGEPRLPLNARGRLILTPDQAPTD